jgi:hypothetical protein
MEALGFSMVRATQEKKVLTTFDVSAARNNYFLLLENAKAQDSQFVEFEDETACVAHDGTEYVLFGYEIEDIFCIDDAGHVLKFLVDGNKFKFVNTDLLKFVRFFSFFQSVVLDLRASYLLTSAVLAKRARSDVDRDRHLDILEEKQKWLERMFASVDPAALKGGFEGGRYWVELLDAFGDDHLYLLPGLGYYSRRGRFKLANP